MSLLDHFTRNAGTEIGENGFPRYSGHQFVAGMLLYCMGDIVRNKTINDFSLTVDDQLQYDEMKTVFDAKTPLQQNLYLHRITSCFSQLEDERMTKSNAATFLEITNA